MLKFKECLSSLDFKTKILNLFSSKDHQNEFKLFANLKLFHLITETNYNHSQTKVIECLLLLTKNLTKLISNQIEALLNVIKLLQVSWFLKTGLNQKQLNISISYKRMKFKFVWLLEIILKHL